MTFSTYAGLLRRLHGDAWATVDLDLGFAFWHYGHRLRCSHVDGDELSWPAGQFTFLALMERLIETQAPIPVIVQMISTKRRQRAELWTEPPLAVATGLYTYPARIDRFVDADTVIASLALGFQHWFLRRRFRLAGLNAPELKTPAGQDALAWLQAQCAPWGPTPPVTMQTRKDRADDYGRYLGILTTPSGVNLNAGLLASGHAVPYKG